MTARYLSRRIEENSMKFPEEEYVGRGVAISPSDSNKNLLKYS